MTSNSISEMTSQRPNPAFNADAPLAWVHATERMRASSRPYALSRRAEGEVDLSNDLHGPVFEPLRNIEVFRQFAVHPELRTLVWPNGADFAPEFLRSSLRVVA